MNARNIGPLTGILFVALVVVAFAMGGETPSSGDPREEIVRYYTDNETSLALASVALALASVALLFFVGRLRRTLRAAEGDDDGLSTVAALGGSLIAAGASIVAGLTFTLADAVDELPPGTVAGLNALNSDMIFTVAVGTAAFNLALGLAVVRHGALPRPLGWTAIVLGIAGLTPLAFFAFVLTGVVIVWASVALARIPPTAAS